MLIWSLLILIDSWTKIIMPITKIISQMHCESQKTSLTIIERKFKYQTKLNLLSNIARKPIIVFFSFLYTHPPPPPPKKRRNCVAFFFLIQNCVLF